MTTIKESDFQLKAKSYELFDYITLILITLVSSVFFWGVELIVKAASYFSSEVAYQVLSSKYTFLIIKTIGVVALGLIASLFIKLKLGNKVSQYWGLASVLCFSLLGSFFGAVFSSNSYSPFLTGIGISLGHVACWAWRNESRARSTLDKKLLSAVSKIESSSTYIHEYVDTLVKSSDKLDSKITTLTTTTDTLKDALKSMPDKNVYEVIYTQVHSTRPFLVKLYQEIWPHMHNNSVPPKSSIDYISNINASLSILLRSLCVIAKGWTLKATDHFASNIFLYKSAEKKLWSHLEEEGFSNGECFFLDGTKLEYLSVYCKGVLYTDTSISSIDQDNEEKKILAQPLLLPIGIKSTVNSIIVPGAPEAFEKNKPCCISNIIEISNVYKHYSDDRQKQMRQHFKERYPYETIVSLPIPLASSIVPPDDNRKEYDVIGVVNLYSENKGGVKDINALYQLCSPLLHYISDLLCYREFLLKCER